MGRTVSALALAGGLLGVAACVDLFHSTDFETLCTIDAAACVVEDTGSPKPDARNPPTEAGVKDVDFCTKYTSEDAGKAAQRVCTWVTSCLPSRQDSAYANCYARALAAFDCDFNPFLRPRGESVTFWNCLSSVDSCSAVEACVFGGVAPPCKATSGGTFTQCAMTGSAVFECGPSTTPLSIEPCAVYGRTCKNVDGSTARCTGKGGTGADCPTTPKCVSGHAVACADPGDGIKIDVGTDCTLIGSGTCVAADDNIACTPGLNAPTCTASSQAISCKGSTAESCVENATVRIDCSKLDQVCNSVAAKPFDPISACKAPANLCTAGPDTCDASKLVLQSCRGGSKFDFTCSKVDGFSGCDDTGGIARCVPK